jgi:hypothetical protein
MLIQQSIGPVAGCIHHNNVYIFYYDPTSRALCFAKSGYNLGPMTINHRSIIHVQGTGPVVCTNNDTTHPLAAVTWTYGGKDHVSYPNRSILPLLMCE